MTNVSQIGYGDEILRGFLQTLHGNVGISVVDKGFRPAEPTALGPPPPKAHRILTFVVGIFGSDSVLLAEGSVPRVLIRLRGPG